MSFTWIALVALIASSSLASSAALDPDESSHHLRQDRITKSIFEKDMNGALFDDQGRSNEAKEMKDCIARCREECRETTTTTDTTTTPTTPTTPTVTPYTFCRVFATSTTFPPNFAALSAVMPLLSVTLCATSLLWPPARLPRLASHGGHGYLPVHILQKLTSTSAVCFLTALWMA